MNWKRKKVNQHKDLRTPKYRQRVVPLIRNEKREKAIEQEEKLELEELRESNHSRDGHTSG